MANIVLIDSEQTVRALIAEILRLDGHVVRAFGVLDHALSAIRTSTPDLVLTNVFLQGTSGHVAMAKLHDEFPELPVLMVSGVPDDKAIRDWIGEPGFDIFPKPFKAEQLRAKIKAMIKSLEIIQPDKRTHGIP